MKYRNVLRYLLLVLSMLFSVCQFGNAQATPVLPDCIQNFSFSAAGRSIAFDNRSQVQFPSTRGCTNWHMIYTVSGFSAVSVEMDQAPDSNPSGNPGSWVVWPAANVIGTLPMTTTTFNQVSTFGYAPWVSVNVNSVTGTGTISGVFYGWRGQGTSDTSSGATPVNPAIFIYKHINSLTSTQVKTGSGYLHGFVINTKGATSSTATLFDNTACSGTTIAVIDTTAGIGMVLEDVQFNVGLCVLTAAGTVGDYTVSYK